MTSITTLRQATWVAMSFDFDLATKILDLRFYLTVLFERTYCSFTFTTPASNMTNSFTCETNKMSFTNAAAALHRTSFYWHVIFFSFVIFWKGTAVIYSNLALISCHYYPANIAIQYFRPIVTSFHFNSCFLGGEELQLEIHLFLQAYITREDVRKGWWNDIFTFLLILVEISMYNGAVIF